MGRREVCGCIEKNHDISHSFPCVACRFVYNPETPFFDMLVPTVETVKFSWLLSRFLDGDKVRPA